MTKRICRHMCILVENGKIVGAVPYVPEKTFSFFTERGFHCVAIIRMSILYLPFLLFKHNTNENLWTKLRNVICWTRKMCYVRSEYELETVSIYVNNNTTYLSSN